MLLGLTNSPRGMVKMGGGWQDAGHEGAGFGPIADLEFIHASSSPLFHARSRGFLCPSVKSSFGYR